MNLIRFISAILCVVFVGAVFCGCETAVTGDGETDETAAGAVTDQYGRAYTADSLPDNLGFGGAAVNILTREGEWALDFYVESMNGEVVNDAVFERNRRVEERLDVDINVITGPLSNTATGEAIGDMLRVSVMANDKAYDIAAFYSFYGGSTLAPEGLLYNVLDMLYLDLSMPWWNNSFAEELTLYDQLYYLEGDLNLSTVKSLRSVFFNMSKITDYHGEYAFLYDAVYVGTWTFDMFLGLVKDRYEDLNLSGTQDEGDFYGLLVREDNQGAWVHAFGMSLVTKDGEGIPRLSLYGDKSVAVYEMLYKLYRETPGVYFGPKSFAETAAFGQGQGLFVITELSTAANSLRDMNDGYSLLPMPKYNEAQDGYYNSIRDTSNLIGVPVTIDDPDMVSAVLELMSAESYRAVTPAYFEIAMKEKYLSDSDSGRIFDLILEGMRVDFGQVYSLAIAGGTYDMKTAYHVLMRNMIREKDRDFASRYASNEQLYQNSLDNILAIFESME